MSASSTPAWAWSSVVLPSMRAVAFFKKASLTVSSGRVTGVFSASTICRAFRFASSFLQQALMLAARASALTGMPSCCQVDCTSSPKSTATNWPASSLRALVAETPAIALGKKAPSHRPGRSATM